MKPFEHTHDRLHDLIHEDVPFAVLIASKDRKTAIGEEAWGLSLESAKLEPKDILMVLGLFLRHVMQAMKMNFRDVMGTLFHVVDTGLTPEEKLKALRQQEEDSTRSEE